MFRDGALDDVGDELEHLGAHHSMLIVSPHDNHMAERVQRAVGARQPVVWTDIGQHVSGELAERATAAAIDSRVDVLVTVGGDAAIGLGKAVAVRTGLPLVCVPTTYSGSEMTPIYALSSDHDWTPRRDGRALPKVVIYDPQLLAALPPVVVGARGMSALAHCAEALWAPRTDPITDALALAGARRLTRHLRSACREPGIAASAHLMIGSCLAGIALGSAGGSIHHALCDLLAGRYGTPHALTHAIVLPYSVKFVRPAVPVAIKRLAAAMDTVSEDLPGAIWSLGRSVGTPQGLRAIGISESQIELAADAALAEEIPSPRPLNRSLVGRLLEGAWRGMSPSIP